MKEFAYRETTEPIVQEGVVVRRDLMLQIDKDYYKLSIATPGYIKKLNEYNQQLEKDVRLEDNIMALDSVADLRKTVGKLSQMPSEDVFPYLVKQDAIPEELGAET